MRFSISNSILCLVLVLVRLCKCHPQINTINFVHYEISSDQLSKYSSLRDLPLPENRAKGLPFILLLRALAFKLNVSNIVTKNWFRKDIMKSLTLPIKQLETTDEVTILTFVTTFSSGPLRAPYQWERYDSLGHSPIFFNVNDMAWNFIYCDLPRWKREPIWSLSVLTSVFDNSTWIYFTIAFLSVCLALGPSQFDTNIFLLMSSILTSGIRRSPKTRKLIFIVWLLHIRILVDIYSGSVSSRLISPPAERALTTFGELDRNNYSAALTGDNITPLLKRFFSSVTSNKTGTWINKGFIHIKNVYSRGIMGPASIQNQIEMAQFIVKNYKSKVVQVGRWHQAMQKLNIIEDARENGIQTFTNYALCHLGKEMVNGGSYLWTFLPPNHKRIARYFQILTETGIFSHLQQEHEAISHSVRVQERSRVVGKTHLKKGRYDEKIKQRLNQHLEGKLWKVFFLWSLCLLTSFIGFVSELVCSFKKKTNVVILKQKQITLKSFAPVRALAKSKRKTSKK